MINLQFSLKDILWLTTLLVALLCWYLSDRRRIAQLRWALSEVGMKEENTIRLAIEREELQSRVDYLEKRVLESTPREP